MKKNIILAILLSVYVITFILLFIKLRSMSSTVSEELVQENVYYILGFLFIAGISTTLYLIMDGNNNKFAVSLHKETENFTFSNTISSTEQKEEVFGNDLDKIKSELSAIANSPSQEREKWDKVVWKICNHFQLSQALLYMKEEGRGQLTIQSSYAFILSENDPRYIISGEGLTGQAVVDKSPYFIKDVPEGYMKVISGLGEALPKSLLIIPCMNEEDEVVSVFELSSLQEYSKSTYEEIVAVCNYVSSLLTK